MFEWHLSDGIRVVTLICARKTAMFKKRVFEYLFEQKMRLKMNKMLKSDKYTYKVIIWYESFDASCGSAACTNANNEYPYCGNAQTCETHRVEQKDRMADIHIQNA